MKLLLFLPLFLLHSVRSTTVHLFEWKFDDIAKECVEFLAPYGYSAVQVSPVNEYAVLENRPWFERYQPFSYKIISRSGNEEDFRRMVKTCSSVGIKIYVDVIINHMTANLPSNIKGSGGSDADTSSKYYPAVPYSHQDFHTTCQLNNYQNASEVRNCELVGLHDLDQSKDHVRQMCINFLNGLIDMGVAGIRVDAAKHMWPKDLEFIYGSLKNLNTEFGHKANTRPFIYQEVADQGGSVVTSQEYTYLGHVTEFKYGAALTDAFRGKNKLKSLQNFGEQWGMLNSQRAFVFVDNHDKQRENLDQLGSFLNHKSPKLYKMAVGFMLSWPYGTKRVMSSYFFDKSEQGPPHNDDMTIKNVSKNPDLTCNDGWVCEHRWRQIYSMVKFDQVTQGTPVMDFQHNDMNQISFCRGNKGFVAINNDNFNMNINRKVCLPSGIYCDVISGLKLDNKCTGKVVKVDNNGMANIEIKTDEEDGIIALHVEAKLD